MPEYNDNDLIKMQNDAMKRVMEMQRRAKESYSTAQSPPGQNPGAQVGPGQASAKPVFSSQGSAMPQQFGPHGQGPVQNPTQNPAQNPIQIPDLIKQLFILLGTDDPILNAALAYLL